MSDERWIEEELRSAVVAYIDMHERVARGEGVNKSAFYRRLHERHPNLSAKTFERRFMNISHVYRLMGRHWTPGLAPMHNVGTNVIATIERLIHETEGRPQPPVAVFEAEVARLLRTRGRLPKPSGEHNPGRRTRETPYYQRDPAVVAWLRQEANGVCECCDAPAPFTKPDGEPYLEVHHLRRLADGGSDTVENAVAICPNCHREIHHGAEQGELRDRLYLKQKRLIPE